MTPLRLIAATCALIAAPVLLHAQREKLPPDDYDIVMKKWPLAQTSNTGIRYIIETAGKGPLLMPGDKISVHYTGWLLNGKIFDQNHDDKKPFSFRLDRGEVIVGWDQILQSMRPGDKWLLIVPPELAYGRRGEPPVIPSYATLVFEVEIVAVTKDN